LAGLLEAPAPPQIHYSDTVAGAVSEIEEKKKELERAGAGEAMIWSFSGSVLPGVEPVKSCQRGPKGKELVEVGSL